MKEIQLNFKFPKGSESIIKEFKKTGKLPLNEATEKKLADDARKQIADYIKEYPKSSFGYNTKVIKTIAEKFAQIGCHLAAAETYRFLLEMSENQPSANPTFRLGTAIEASNQLYAYATKMMDTPAPPGENPAIWNAKQSAEAIGFMDQAMRLAYLHEFFDESKYGAVHMATQNMQFRMKKIERLKLHPENIPIELDTAIENAKKIVSAAEDLARELYGKLHPETLN